MALSVIRATFRCDGCDCQFRVDIDPVRRAWERRQDMFSIAVDAIRGGVTDDGGFCSVQHDMHLCDKCTQVADAINADDENYTPSREEIVEALESQVSE